MTSRLIRSTGLILFALALAPSAHAVTSAGRRQPSSPGAQVGATTSAGAAQRVPVCACLESQVLAQSFCLCW